MKNKDCTCGVMRGIENGHNSTCPRFEISPRQASYNEAISKATQKDLIKLALKIDRMKENLQELEEEFSKRRVFCTHKASNGKSALAEGINGQFCQICYWQEYED